MTQDQIKAIAKEYAKWVSENPKDYPWHSSDAKAVLTFLNNRYCIVERKEAFRLYNNATMLLYDSSRDFNTIGKAAKSVLETLFGTSMFNQNVE